MAIPTLTVILYALPAFTNFPFPFNLLSSADDLERSHITDELIGVVKRLEKEIGIEAMPAKFDTQIAGGLGGALFAQRLLKKKLAAAQ